MSNLSRTNNVETACIADILNQEAPIVMPKFNLKKVSDTRLGRNLMQLNEYLEK